MEKSVKAVFAAVVGAVVGAVGLSILVYLLLWGLNPNPKQMSNDLA